MGNKVIHYHVRCCFESTVQSLTYSCLDQPATCQVTAKNIEIVDNFIPLMEKEGLNISRFHLPKRRNFSAPPHLSCSVDKEICKELGVFEVLFSVSGDR